MKKNFFVKVTAPLELGGLCLFYLLTPTFSPSLRYTSLEPTRNRRPADSRNYKKLCNSLGAASLVLDISRDSPNRSGYTRRGPIRTASRTATVTDCNSCVCLKTVYFSHAYIHLCETFRFAPSTYSYLTCLLQIAHLLVSSSNRILEIFYVCKARTSF